MKREDRRFIDRFWNAICKMDYILILIFSVLVTCLVLIGLTYVFIGTDEIGQVILQLTLILILVLLPAVMFSIYYCRKIEY